LVREVLTEWANRRKLRQQFDFGTSERIRPSEPIAPSREEGEDPSTRLGVSPEALRPVDHIADVGCPVFILGGTADNRTTPEETKRLFSAARERKQLWLVPGAAHIDLARFAPAEYRRRVLGFLAAGPR
jgi:fermentation-respiration switch protein FrsA (DUF1100 family)